MHLAALFSRVLLVIPLALSTVPGCDALTGASPAPTPPTTLDEARSRWEARGFTDYCYRFERSCFCSPSHLSATVMVRRDTVAALHDVRANGTPIEETEDAFDREMARSIEQLFALIEAADRTTIDSVAVTYDAQYGHPTMLHVDPFHAMATDDMTIAAHRVTALAACSATD